MRRLALMIFTAVVFLARPAWPSDERPAGSGAAPAAAPQPRATSLQLAGGHGADDAAAQRGPVLFVPVQLDAHGTGAGTDNYGRPLQPRAPQ